MDDTEKEYRELKNIKFYALSLVTHIKGPNCVDLSDAHLICPGCGVGHISVMEKK